VSYLVPRFGRDAKRVLPHYRGPVYSLDAEPYPYDCVYIVRDLSLARDAQYRRTGPARHSVIRLFDAGVTRAREALYIRQRASGMRKRKGRLTSGPMVNHQAAGQFHGLAHNPGGA
jgi:hypothetical protein